MADRRLNNRSLGRRFGAAGFVFGLVSALVLGVPGCGKSGEAPSGSATKQETPAETTTKTQTVEINGHTFELELALDDDEREQGLSDRKEIAEDGGMLFVFPNPVYGGFVMRRCYVPIDLIYVDDDGYIDSLHRMSVIEPIGGDQWHDPSGSYSYRSAGLIQFVIELKGGTLDKLKLRRGDKIDLPREKLQSMAQ